MTNASAPPIRCTPRRGTARNKHQTYGLHKGLYDGLPWVPRLGKGGTAVMSS